MKPNFQYLILFFLLLISRLLIADEVKVIGDSTEKLTLQVVSEYILGDADTRIDGKNLARRQAKTAASEKAGSFIYSLKTIKNDEITKESITTLSASLMSTADQLIEYSFTSDNRTKLTLTLKVVIDKGALNTQLSLIENDQARRLQVEKLEGENKRLNKELESLQTQISENKYKSSENTLIFPSKKLVDQRQSILIGLNSNEKKVRKIFEPGESFKKAKRQTSDYDAAKIEFDNLWQAIETKTQVTIGEPSFKSNFDDTYDVSIPVVWKMHSTVISDIKTVTQRYLRSVYTGEQSALYLGWTDRDQERQRHPYSTKLFSDLYKKRIYIEITIGGETQKIVLGTVLKHKTRYYEFSEDRSSYPRFNKNVFVFYTRSPTDIQAYSDNRFSIALMNYNNVSPAVFKNKSDYEVLSLDSISAKVVVE